MFIRPIGTKKRAGEVRGPIGVRDWTDPDGTALDPRVKVIQTPEELEWFEKWLWSEGRKTPMAVDTEFRGCDLDKEHPYKRARATSAQFCPVGTDQMVYLDNWGACEGNLQVVRKWWVSEEHAKVFHHYPADGHCVQNHFGVEMRGLFADTLGMDWLRDTSREGRHNLKEVAEDYLGMDCPSYAATFKRPKQLKKGGESKVLEVVPHYQWWDEGYRARVVNYASADPYLTGAVFLLHRAHLEQVPWSEKLGRSYWEYYREFEVPFAEILYRMERRGMLIDLEYTQRLQEELLQLAEEKGRAFYRGLREVGVSESFLMGTPPKYKDRFNPNAPQQLAELLFNQLGLTPTKPTEDSRKKLRRGEIDESMVKWSTDHEVLEELAQENPILEDFMEWRHLQKLMSTYTEMMLRNAPFDNGFIHTLLRQLTRTGRLSSALPNFQNVPVRSELGKRIRRCFVAPPGMLFADADYDQIEWKVTAHETRDPVMIKNVIEGVDAHSQTAYFVVEEVRRFVEENGGPLKSAFDLVKKMFPEWRARAKTNNFAVIYGAGPSKVASIWGVTPDQGQEYIDRIYGGYPGLQRYMDRKAEEAHRFGYVRTLLRRYLHFPPAQGKTYGMRLREERQAGNWPIQGGARDVIMMAMLVLETPRGGEVYEWLRSRGIELRMQVHDELIWYCPKGLEKEMQSVVVPAMSDPYPYFGFSGLRVPTTASMEFGENWGEAH